MKRKLMWIGHSPTLQSGFGRVSQNILHYLKEEWDISVLGIGFTGDAHNFPYRLFPAGNEGDQWGLNRLEKIYFGEKPDAICILMEPWNIMPYVMNLRAGQGAKPKIVAYVVVDGENMKADHGHWLKQCDVTIFATDFAAGEAMKAGWDGAGYSIPHGVNPLIYQPCDKQWARKQMGLGNLLDSNAFIFNNVNMNAPRKCIDISIEAFALFLEMAGNPPEPMLNLHLNRQMEEGWDIGQLARYYKIPGKISVISEDVKIYESGMRYVYNCADVQVTTTSGEGFGLTTLEGMACGIPQITPDFSGLKSWTGDACVKVPATRKIVNPKQQNVVRYAPEPEEVAYAMLRLYQDAAYRQEMATKARKHALQDCFQWSVIADGFDEALHRAMESKGLSGTILTDTKPVGPSGAELAQEQRQA